MREPPMWSLGGWRGHSTRVHITAPPPCVGPVAPAGLQLRRRAGIPTDADSADTLAAFSAAVEQHEAQLRVQDAGGWAGG